MAKVASTSTILLKPQILLKSYANSFAAIAGNADCFTKQQYRFFYPPPPPHHHHLHRSLSILRRSPKSKTLPLLRSRPRPIMSSSSSSSLSSLNASDSQPIKTVKVVVKGRVQGVFYRNWTIDNATELGLRGWVRNRRDGSVEALFSGSPDKVQEMQDRCVRGPPSAIVTGLNISPCNEDPGTGFERRSTV